MRRATSGTRRPGRSGTKFDRKVDPGEVGGVWIVGRVEVDPDVSG